MSFKKNKYSVLKNAISKELANFVYNYFKNKRNVAKVLFESKYIGHSSPPKFKVVDISHEYLSLCLANTSPCL